MIQDHIQLIICILYVVLKNNISQCLMNSSTQNVSITSGNKETYWERSLGFLIIGIIGILANFVLVIILGSSVKIREKTCKYSYNSSKFC